MKYQVCRPLTPIEYEALRNDVADNGVLVPVEVDENGDVLDGHHRIRAWEELTTEGKVLPDYPRIIRAGLSEEQKRNHARKLNALRRQMTKEEREQMMVDMRLDGMSYRKIAEATGVPRMTAQRLVENSGVPNGTPEYITGADGKQYPAKVERKLAPPQLSLPSNASRVVLSPPAAKNFISAQSQREVVKSETRFVPAKPIDTNEYDDLADELEADGDNFDWAEDEQERSPATMPTFLFATGGKQQSSMLGTIQRAKEEAPDLFDDIASGKMKITAAQRELRHREIQNTPPLPTDKYRVIYADPPWHYNNEGTISDSDNYGRAARHYPTMTIDQLCAMGADVKAMSEPDSVLFLWTTSPLLEESFSVISAWGFKYKSSFVWDKVAHNFAHYNSMRHEFLLVCTRGSCLPDSKQLIDSVVSIEKSRKHSQKPQEFRTLIDTLYTHGRRIELFARDQNEGWDTWGNEAESSLVGEAA